MDDILIANAIVVTVDSNDRILRDAAIAIRGREIVAIGPSDVVSAQHPAREVIDAGGMVTLPGVVNAYWWAAHPGTWGWANRPSRVLVQLGRAILQAKSLDSLPGWRARCFCDSWA